MLTEQDYSRAANELGCDLATLKAVAHVESESEAFLPDGRPKILFEAHHFHRLTQGRFSARYPSLSSPTWDRKLYKGGAGEWMRLEQAQGLNHPAALMSASWGRFQIMGFNHVAAGFVDLHQFVKAMEESEPRQLDAFVSLIKAWELDDELQRHDWAGFARIYNGKGFKANKYDTRLDQAYTRLSKIAKGAK